MTIEHHAQAVEQALVTYRTGMQQLHKDGKPIYAPEEHDRRVTALKSSLGAAFHRAERALQAEIHAAEAELAEAKPDPLTLLSDTELARASSLRPFIAEDAERLSAEAFAERAQQAIERGDKAAVALFHRYAQQKRAEAGPRQFTGPLRDIVTALEAALFDTKKRDAAEARRDAAQRMAMQITRAKYLHEQYGHAVLETRERPGATRARGMTSHR